MKITHKMKQKNKVWDHKGISVTKGGTVVLPKAKHRRVPLRSSLYSKALYSKAPIAIPEKNVFLNSCF